MPVDPERRPAVLKKLKETLAKNWLGVNGGENLIGISCTAKDLNEINDLYFKLVEDEELSSTTIVFGLYTIDNSVNSEYMRPY